MNKIKKKKDDIEILSNIYEFIEDFKDKRTVKYYLEEKINAIVKAWKARKHAPQVDIRKIVSKQMYSIMTGHSESEKSEKKKKRKIERPANWRDNL